MKYLVHVLLILISLPLHAAYRLEVNSEVSCETILSPSTEIQKALAQFPNEFIRGQEISYEPNTPTFLKFKEALNTLPADIEAVPHEIITSGIFDWPFDHRELLNLPIVGHFTEVESTYRYAPGGIAGPIFVSGTIIAVKSVWPIDFYDQGKEPDERNHQLHTQFVLTIDTPKGQVEVAHREGHGTTDFYILRHKTSAEEKLREAFERARYDDWVRTSFGPNTEAMDYEVATKALQIYFSMPGTYGIPATVNTLRGLKEATRKHESYGILKDNKRYSTAKLEKFLRYAQDFARAQGVESVKSIETERSDVSIDRRTTTDLSTYFLKLVSERQTTASTLEAPKEPIFTAKDFEKAAFANLNFDDVEKISDELTQAASSAKLTEAEVRTYTQDGHRRLKLVSKRKIANGTRYRYEVEQRHTFMITAQLSEKGRKHRYSINFKPYYEVTFGNDPQKILDSELTWALDGGMKRSTFTFEPTAEGLVEAFEKFRAEQD